MQNMYEDKYISCAYCGSDNVNVEGKYDNLPEEAFRLVGGIEDVVEKAKKLAGNN